MELIIDDISYKIPERLTVQQWCQLGQWNLEDRDTWPHLLGTLTGAPINKLVMAPESALELGATLCATLMQERREVQLPDWGKIRFGEWVDVETYLSLGIQNRLGEILKVWSLETEWSDEGLYVVEHYLRWREGIYKMYKNLFGLDEEREEEEETKRPDPQRIQRQWYRIIVDQLAGNDILKLDGVVEQGLIKTLNFLSLQKQMKLEEQEQLQQQKRHYDLQRTR